MSDVPHSDDILEKITREYCETSDGARLYWLLLQGWDVECEDEESGMFRLSRSIIRTLV